jgi:hypothetical protein
MRKFTGFRLSPKEKDMLDDVKDLFQGRLSYTNIVVMGIYSLYELSQEVRKQVEDPDERIVLFEWVRVTRDAICREDVKWNLDALRETWGSSRQQEYKEEILSAAEFLRQGKQFKERSAMGDQEP